MQTDTLANCVYALRAEAGHSLSTAQGQNVIDVLKYLLKRAQLELWTAYQWPTLMQSGDTPMVAGQYVYNYPVGFDFEAIRQSYTAPTNSSNWLPLAYGIDETYIMPGGANSQSGDGPQFWRAEQAQFRIWPTPVSASNWTRFRGMKPLLPFLADADVSTLDAMSLVLFTAAEILARAKAEDAANKLKKAQTHLLAVLGNTVSAKKRISTLGSGSLFRQPVPGIDYVAMSG
jgi:hypothetical protein